MQFNAKKSSVYEIMLVCATCPVSLLMRTAILAWLHNNTAPSTWNLFILDFFCIVVPGVVCMTIFSSFQDIFLASLFCAAGILFTFIIDKRFKVKQTNMRPEQVKTPLMNTYMPSRRNFITYFRAYTLLAAVIAILAVDFYEIFPRRFRKREKYGVGLMDVGVGGFMVASGLTRKEIRAGFNFKGCSFTKRLNHVLSVTKSTIPLWILGLLRALFSWLTGYHVNPSEYGLYWNFFLTLAVVQVFSTVLLTLFPPRSCFLLALVISLTYEYALYGLDLRQFVLKGSDGKSSREGFLNANREGLLSCFGHLSINLASAAVGRYFSLHGCKYRDWLKSFIQLLVIDCVFWIILGHLDSITEPISRRMANLGYIVWMMAHQLFLLCGFFFVDLLEIVMKQSHLVKEHNEDTRARKDLEEGIEIITSDFSLMEAINRNGLFFFLLANLLTGAINITVDTKVCSAGVASSLLLLYMFLLSVTAAILHVRNITVKFW